MDVTEIVFVGEPTVEGEIARNVIGHCPIDQPTEQHVVIAKLDALLLTLLAFDKPVERQRIVLAGRANVIDDQIVMDDLVALFGVIPEVADVLDERAGMVRSSQISGTILLSEFIAKTPISRPIFQLCKSPDLI